MGIWCQVGIPWEKEESIDLSLRAHTRAECVSESLGRSCAPRAARPLLVIEINYDLLCYVLIKSLLYRQRRAHAAAEALEIIKEAERRRP